MAETGLDGVMAAKPIFAGRARIQGWLSRLESALKADDRAAANAVLDEAIPDFSRREQSQPDAPEPLSSLPVAASRP